MYLVVDNGSEYIKSGLISLNEKQFQNEPILTQNSMAYQKKLPNIKIFGDDIDKVKTYQSELIYVKPHERGYLIDPLLEIQLWDQVLQRLNISNPNEQLEGIILTIPLFTPKKIRQQIYEIIFEQYQFKSLYDTSAAELTSFNFPNQSTQLVIDSGYSFTHIVPIVNYKPIKEYCKRINVGGKLLTNYLKESLSYRQFNVLNETYLIDIVKKETCFTSLNFKNDLLTCSKRNADNELWLNYVLPDYQYVNKGFVLEQELTDEQRQNYQLLKMNQERIIIPEILFQPSIVGLKSQCGIVEGIEQSLANCTTELKKLFYENITLSGGNVNFKNFKERLQIDLASQVPQGYNLKINDNLDIKPELLPFLGAQKLLQNRQDIFNSNVLTKSAYLERYSRISKKA